MTERSQPPEPIRPLDPSDDEWFQFLEIMLVTLGSGLVIVLARMAFDIAVTIADRRDLRPYVLPALAGSVVVVWLPAAFLTIKSKLSLRIAKGQLPATTSAGFASLLLCLCSMAAAAVFVLSYGTALQGKRGSGAFFLWFVANMGLTWLGVRYLKRNRTSTDG